MYYNSNNWYDGEWFEDKKHGFGQRQYPDGTKYKGDYLDDSRNGQGTMVFPNNDVSLKIVIFLLIFKRMSCSFIEANGATT